MLLREVKIYGWGSDAASVPYDYLLIDLKHSTDDIITLRKIFPGEQTRIYESKELSKTWQYQPSYQ